MPLGGRWCAPDAFNQPLDVAQRCFRQDTVAEIENKRTLRKGSKNCIDRTIHGCTAGKQSQWIEIALNRTPLLDHRPRKFKLDRPIEPDRIDRNRIQIAADQSVDSDEIVRASASTAARRPSATAIG